MKHRGVLLLSFTLISLVVPSSVFAQKIRFALSITERETGGIIQSTFASALRSLGDVEVVQETERPQYTLSGVVLCQPGCSNANSYVVSLRLFSQVDTNAYKWMLPSKPSGASDPMRNVLMITLSGLEEHHQMWVISWGRSRYEQAARELIAEIDSRCLEKNRYVSRLSNSLTKQSTSDLNSFLKSKEWLC